MPWIFLLLRLISLSNLTAWWIARSYRQVASFSYFVSYFAQFLSYYVIALKYFYRSLVSHISVQKRNHILLIIFASNIILTYSTIQPCVIRIYTSLLQVRHVPFYACNPYHAHFWLTYLNILFEISYILVTFVLFILQCNFSLLLNFYFINEKQLVSQ